MLKVKVVDLHFPESVNQVIRQLGHWFRGLLPVCQTAGLPEKIVIYNNLRFFRSSLIISIMLICQFGFTHTPITLSSTGALPDVAVCAPSLQAVEDYGLIGEDFFNAIVEANYEVVQRALEAGVSPNVFVVRAVQKTNDKRRFLNFRVPIYELVSHIDRSVLDRASGMIPGVFVNATALHLAVIVGDPYIVRLFLESEDVRVDIKTLSGLTPFSLLAFDQQGIEPLKRGSMVKLFIQHNPAPTQSDITYTFEQAVIAENFPVIEAIARYAPESHVITRLRRMMSLGVLVLNHFVINRIFLSSDMFRNRQKYHAAIRYLKERDLL